MAQVTGAQQMRDRYGRFITLVQSAGLLAARDEAARLEAYMKEHAPWTDRTGEARAELHAEADAYGRAGQGAPRAGVQATGGGGAAAQVGGDGIQITLLGASDHNVYLELAMGQRYAIIGPTLYEQGPDAVGRIVAAIQSQLAAQGRG